MLSQKYFPHVVSTLYAIILSTVMTLFMTVFATGTIEFPQIIWSILIAILVVTVAGLIFPAGKRGDEFAAKNGLEEGTIRFILLSSIFPTLYFTVIMTFVGTIRATGFTKSFWELYVISLLAGLPVAYIVSVISAPYVMKLARLICPQSTELPLEEAPQEERPQAE